MTLLDRDSRSNLSLSLWMDGWMEIRREEKSRRAILDRKKNRASQLDDRCPAGLIDDAKLLH